MLDCTIYVKLSITTLLTLSPALVSREDMKALKNWMGDGYNVFVPSPHHRGN